MGSERRGEERVARTARGGKEGGKRLVTGRQETRKEAERSRK
jgi:hypothetical protein